MLYSFMTFSTPQLTLQEVLQTARRFGYHGVEPRTDSRHAHGIEVTASQAERASIKKQVAESGITLCCLATSLRYADPARESEVLAETHERIDLAGDLGIPTMRVFGGVIPDGLDRTAGIEQVVKCFREVAYHAAERNVILCMETHDDWCDPGHVAAVLQAVDSPFIACNWDVMHPVRMGKAGVEESFRILKPWIRHTHLHDGITTEEGLKMVPIGTGDIDHKTFVKLLKNDGYTGYLSGEWINWEPWEIHLPREIATLQEYEKNG